ncbi:phage-related baseplate assembly protein [Chitinophaga skermanii]|uniref:Phage-related baseplate assembly protein n=1 Tax=Chitinophaga skermanii TaxID=331697 RepID=A0A327Q7V2_9BACT|nr:baseplate J/gp47 family protein [Chitinophaga skermanii]RAJ00480.1 phage-related baseplate assembly protein [Chitinophaga skermanii]
MPEYQILHENPNQIIDEIREHLQELYKRTLAPGDMEMLIINSFAYRELLLRIAINDAVRQNFIRYSRGAALDELVAYLNVSRLPASKAVCTLKFIAVTGHGGILIPAGTRVQSIDGKATFRTSKTVQLPKGETSILVDAISAMEGVEGNNYDVGNIAVILDPLPYISSATNVDITTGGGNMEDDEALRERFIISTAQFSVAGSKQSYQFYALGVSSTISDVSVSSPTPGTVVITPLLKGGLPPSIALINSIADVCSGEKVRPLTDNVIVEAPTILEYEINITLSIHQHAANTDLDIFVYNTLLQFVKANEDKLGVDILKNKILSLAMSDSGVYNAQIINPVVDIITPHNCYAKCIGISVTTTSIHG